MISGLFNQTETDILTYILPIICCIIVFALPLGGGGGSKQTILQDNDLWFTTQNINEAYETIEKEVENWRLNAIEDEKKVSRSLTSRISNSFKRRPKGERFVVTKSIKPRLYSLFDWIEGNISFELIEVEDGGTTIKASYGQISKERILNFKAQSPLKIPTTPIGNNCPNCGKPILRQFIMCPYCGQKLKGDSEN